MASSSTSWSSTRRFNWPVYRCTRFRWPAFASVLRNVLDFLSGKASIREEMSVDLQHGNRHHLRCRSEKYSCWHSMSKGIAAAPTRGSDLATSGEPFASWQAVCGRQCLRNIVLVSMISIYLNCLGLLVFFWGVAASHRWLTAQFQFWGSLSLASAVCRHHAVVLQTCEVFG